jgi:hypothetical protein
VKKINTVRASSETKYQYSNIEVSNKIPVQQERVQEENTSTVRTSSVTKYQYSKNEFRKKKRHRKNGK